MNEIADLLNQMNNQYDQKLSSSEQKHRRIEVNNGDQEFSDDEFKDLSNYL